MNIKEPTILPLRTHIRIIIDRFLSFKRHNKTTPRERLASQTLCAFKTHASRIQSDDNTTPLFVAFFRENRHRTRVISDDRAALRAPPRRVRNARGWFGFDFEAKFKRFKRTKNASRRERRRGGGRNASRETLRGFYRGAESDGIPTREESVGEG